MGTTAHVREQLAAELDDALADQVPDLHVVDHGDVLDAVTAPTLLVVADQVRPGVVRGVRVHTLSVWVVVPGETPGKADDELDALHELVLEALELARSNVVWTTSERSTYATGNHAWRITCTRED